MPLTHLLGLLAAVILAAGLTIVLAFWAGVPLVALGFGCMAASLIMGWSRIAR